MKYYVYIKVSMYGYFFREMNRAGSIDIRSNIPIKYIKNEQWEETEIQNHFQTKNNRYCLLLIISDWNQQLMSKPKLTY